MLIKEIFGDLLKHDLKTNRGRRIRKLVKSASKHGNPAQYGTPFIAAGPQTSDNGTVQDPQQFSGLF